MSIQDVDIQFLRDVAKVFRDRDEFTAENFEAVADHYEELSEAYERLRNSRPDWTKAPVHAPQAAMVGFQDRREGERRQPNNDCRTVRMLAAAPWDKDKKFIAVPRALQQNSVNLIRRLRSEVGRLQSEIDRLRLRRDQQDRARLADIRASQTKEDH